MADHSSEEPAGEQSAAAPAQWVDLAEGLSAPSRRARQALTLAGVWLVVAAVVALVLLAVGLTFVLRLRASGHP
jgi:hypothetical protein